MEQQRIYKRYAVATWGELYAKAYGELSALIESFHDDTINAEDLWRLYRLHADEHYERVCKLAADGARRAMEEAKLAQGR